MFTYCRFRFAFCGLQRFAENCVESIFWMCRNIDRVELIVNDVTDEELSYRDGTFPEDNLN